MTAAAGLRCADASRAAELPCGSRPSTAGAGTPMVARVVVGAGDEARVTAVPVVRVITTVRTNPAAAAFVSRDRRWKDGAGVEGAIGGGAVRGDEERNGAGPYRLLATAVAVAGRGRACRRGRLRGSPAVSDAAGVCRSGVSRAAELPCRTSSAATHAVVAVDREACA